MNILLRVIGYGRRRKSEIGGSLKMPYASPLSATATAAWHTTPGTGVRFVQWLPLSGIRLLDPERTDLSLENVGHCNGKA